MPRLPRNAAGGRPAAALALLTTGLMGLTGCSGNRGDELGHNAPTRVPTTPEALAYVAATHTGTPDTAGPDDFAPFDAFTDGHVAAILRYNTTRDSYGDNVTITVGTLKDDELLDCDTTIGLYTQRCVETPDGTLRWNLPDPEEDPGGIFVFVDKTEHGEDPASHVVVATYSGLLITADPRTLELPGHRRQPLRPRQRPRVDTTTTTEAERHGERLSYFTSTPD